MSVYVSQSSVRVAWEKEMGWQRKRNEEEEEEGVEEEKEKDEGRGVEFKKDKK